MALSRSPSASTSVFAIAAAGAAGAGALATSRTAPASSVTFIDADLAKRVDERLMVSPGYTIDQLMEVAGLAVANAVHDFLTTVRSASNDASSSSSVDGVAPSPKVLIFAGPGNNGGDGLVAARHLKMFGYTPTVVYPKPGKSAIFTNLIQQLQDLEIDILSEAPSEPSSLSSSSSSALPAGENVQKTGKYAEFDLILDAFFGFSFAGPAREPYASMIASFTAAAAGAAALPPVMSVDIPSGWDVEKGDVHGSGFSPDAVISLTVPKRCMAGFRGAHYVGGRFVPEKIAKELGILLPNYGFNCNQIVKLVGDSDGHCAADSPLPAAGDAEPEPEQAAALKIVYVTASSTEEAQKIARALVAERLAACVNILPGVRSVYEWQGETEQSQEVLMMIKTRASLVDAVSQRVRALHSYDLPESIAVDISAGSPEYVAWVRGQTRRQSIFK